MSLNPTEPWLYLIIYGGIMIFVFVLGLILTLTQKRKGMSIEKKAEKENQTPSKSVL